MAPAVESDRSVWLGPLADVVLVFAVTAVFALAAAYVILP
jgi:hypothetical protein